MAEQSAVVVGLRAPVGKREELALAALSSSSALG
jgi:hypothetical protein